MVYVDREGEEHHLLAAPKVISNMMTLEAENQPSSFIFIPKKREKKRINFYQKCFDTYSFAFERPQRGAIIAIIIIRFLP